MDLIRATGATDSQKPSDAVANPRSFSVSDALEDSSIPDGSGQFGSLDINTITPQNFRNLEMGSFLNRPLYPETNNTSGSSMQHADSRRIRSDDTSNVGAGAVSYCNCHQGRCVCFRSLLTPPPSDCGGNDTSTPTLRFPGSTLPPSEASRDLSVPCYRFLNTNGTIAVQNAPTSTRSVSREPSYRLFCPGDRMMAPSSTAGLTNAGGSDADHNGRVIFVCGNQDSESTLHQHATPGTGNMVFRPMQTSVQASSGPAAIFGDHVMSKEYHALLTPPNHSGTNGFPTETHLVGTMENLSIKKRWNDSCAIVGFKQLLNHPIACWHVTLVGLLLALLFGAAVGLIFHVEFASGSPRSTEVGTGRRGHQKFESDMKTSRHHVQRKEPHSRKLIAANNHSISTAHASDPLRMDVLVPGEQHFYLRTSTPHERQAWLQHLGTVKACVNNIDGSDLLDDNALRQKYCELRVYCDLLMQQVHSIKSIVTDSPIPNVQELDQTTALLGETCDTFINTLEDCLHIATQSPQTQTGQLPRIGADTGSFNGKSSKKGKHKLPVFPGHEVMTKPANTSGSDSDSKARHENNDQLLRSTSLSLAFPSPNGEGMGTSSEAESSDSAAVFHSGQRTRHGASSVPNGSPKENSNQTMNGHHGSNKNNNNMPSEEEISTFFNAEKTTFSTLVLWEDGSLPSDTFLDSCHHLVKIFDSLGSTAFAPVKMDLNGNIRKLSMRYEADPEAYPTMHSIIETEVRKGTTQESDSATDALLWLKRGIWFVREFLVCFGDNEEELSQCASIAYSKTLKPFHGWVVRGMFSLASSAVPSRAVFLSTLSNTTPEETSSPVFKAQLARELTAYIAGVDRCLRSLNTLYRRYDLDPSLSGASGDKSNVVSAFYDP